MKNKIELRQLLFDNPTVVYARVLNNEEIVHYRIRNIQNLVGLSESSSFDIVKNYILESEPDSEIVLKDRSVVYDTSPTIIAADEVLKDFPKIRKQLLKRKVIGQLYQYDSAPTTEEYRGSRYQELIKFSDKKTIIKKHSLSLFKTKLSQFLYRVGLPKLAPLRVHRIVPCSYIAYNYEEQDEPKAFDKILEDLKILSNRKLILGHLSMPKTMAFTNSVGDGIVRKVVFCFLFVDLYKLGQQLGTPNPLNWPKLPLAQLGIGEVHEGSCGENLSKREYNIRIIDLNMRNKEKSNEQ